MYFADTTARDAALTGSILVDGMVSYTPSTGLMYYNGTAWTAVSGATIPTSYGFTAGKNKIINGDFYINQRNFTSNTVSGSYNFDRWLQTNSGGSFTVTPQTFTPGTAPVAGYEGSTYLRGITASQSASADYALFEQKLENVQTYAGQTVVVSFWAKAATGTPKIAIELSQNFGTGGSPSATVNTALGAVTISTSWARYTASVAVPSISGKTIGTTANTSFVETNLWVSAGSSLNTRASSIGIQNNTFDIWGVQVESGSSATSFQTATGTLQGELAACQRYYTRQTSALSAYARFSTVSGMTSATEVYVPVPLPVAMRTKPSVIDYANLSVSDGAGTFITVTAATIDQSSQYLVNVYLTVSGTLTTVRPYSIQVFNNTSAYLGFGAEL